MQDLREFRGQLDVHGMTERLKCMVQSYECLRTRIDQNNLTQYVVDDAELNLVIEDLRTLPEDTVSARLDAIRTELRDSVFDLEGSPWVIWVVKLPAVNQHDRSHVSVFIKFDALIIDGYGVSQLINELFGVIEDKNSKVIYEIIESTNSDKNKANAYWKKKLQGVKSVIDLPWRAPLDTLKQSPYRRITRAVNKKTTDEVKRVFAKHGLFNNTAINSLLLEILASCTKDGVATVGIPVAMPSNTRENNSNFIIVSWRRGGRDSFLERARTLQNDIHQGMHYQSVSGIELNRALMQRLGTRLITPVVITSGLAWPRLPEQSPMVLYSGQTQTPQTAIDIRLTFSPAGQLVLDVDYAEYAVAHSFAESIADTMVNLMAAVARSGLDEGSLPKWGIVPASAARYEEEKTYSDFPFLRMIAENLFAQKSGKCALITEGVELSYEELGERVLLLMAALKERGATEGKVVAICLHKGFEFVICVLACALSGCVWVPLDRTSPLKRIRDMLETCSPDIVVCDGSMTLAGATNIDELKADRFTAGDIDLRYLANLSGNGMDSYYLFTSGSTGTPKCVKVTNRATSNVIGATVSNWKITENDVLFSATPFHHDMAVFDIFGALAMRASLVLPARQRLKDARHWAELIEKHKVTIWCSVPAMVEMLLVHADKNTLRSLRILAQGGDFIDSKIISRIFSDCPGIRQFSLGGPTETTIWSIWYEIKPSENLENGVPYGFPLPGNLHYILDTEGNVCLPGVVGRIYSVGINLTNGYLEPGPKQQPDFPPIEDRHGEMIRSFRTGDLGYYRDDGCIMFKSRVEGYVKVRGVRISLADIERAVALHPDVIKAIAVDVHHSADAQKVIAVAYVTKDNYVLGGRAMRRYLAAQLPESHIPTIVNQISSIPLNANGKPDRAAIRALLIRKDGEAPCYQNEEEQSQRQMDGTECAVLGAVGEVIGKQPNTLSGADALISVGILPSRMKHLRDAIKRRSGVNISATELLRCKTLIDVNNIIKERLRTSTKVTDRSGCSDSVVRGSAQDA